VRVHPCECTGNPVGLQVRPCERTGRPVELYCLWRWTRSPAGLRWDTCVCMRNVGGDNYMELRRKAGSRVAESRDGIGVFGFCVRVHPCERTGRPE